MENIILKPLFHKNMECIGIYFAKNNELQTIVQKQSGGRWSKTNSCWYVSCTQNNYEQLAKSLSGKVILETGELKKYLLEKKKNGPVQKLPVAVSVTPPVKIEAQKNPLKKKKRTVAISKENEDAMRQYRQQLVLKSYSPSTIKTYTNEFMQFLQAIRANPANEFSVQRLKDYFQYCFEKLKLSENTLHSRINSLKFYYEQVLSREKFFWEIPRPKKPLLLPNVLGENEIARLFNSISNIKHKAILFTAYSAGLRVSEVTALQIKHVDSDRMQLLIKSAKGKKDRYVGLLMRA